MKKSVFFDDYNKRLLIIDISTGALEWTENYDNSFSKLDMKSAQELYESKSNNFMDIKPPDVKLEKFQSSNNFSKKMMDGKTLLKMGNKQIGEVSTSIYTKDLETFNKQGGIILTADINKGTLVLFFMPFLKRYEKDVVASKKSVILEQDLFGDKSEIINVKLEHKENVYQRNRNYNDYIETPLLLPKELFQNSDGDSRTLELLNKNHKLINEMHQDLSLKLNYLNNQIKASVDNQSKDEYIKKLEAHVHRLNAQIEVLINDRKLLEQEKEKAELIALNKLKSDLKVSKVAIDRQIDLDENFSVNNKLNAILTRALQVAGIKEEHIKSMLANELIKSELIDLTNNLDSKIQSLLDIKNEFKQINL